MSNVKMIFAQSQNGIIGNAGKLPWHLPEDLKYFKSLTEGKTVLMGRKTFESIPTPYRPLPNRKNVVVTRDTNYILRKEAQHPDIKVVTNLNGFLMTHLNEEIWVIGGLELYTACRYIVDEIHITTVLKDFIGDTLAPVIDTLHSFKVISETAIRHSESTNLDYKITVLKRN